MDRPSRSWCLAEWLRWQERLHPKAIDLGLERVQEVARRLGVMGSTTATVTVGGTNGKGATATLVACVYRASGYRVGLYTSPHLLRYNERVVIDGHPAPDDHLCEAFLEIEKTRGNIPLTYFEFGTLAALWLFEKNSVDIRVLEVGLGGRLDAVNIVDPDCAVLTNVGLDHVAFLGNDRESIGREKAGIFRRDAPAICVDPSPPLSVLATASKVGARLQRLEEDFSYRLDNEVWHWQGQAMDYQSLPRPGIDGAIQVRNASGVLAVIQALQDSWPVPEAAIRHALPRLHLSGRLERRGDLLLDVAHNEESVMCLSDHVRSLGDKAPAQLVLGMLKDKPVERVAHRLAPRFRTIYAAGLPTWSRGLSGAALASRLAAIGIRSESCADVPTAISRARQRDPNGLILVCGSFLTVSAALSSI